MTPFIPSPTITYTIGTDPSAPGSSSFSCTMSACGPDGQRIALPIIDGRPHISTPDLKSLLGIASADHLMLDEPTYILLQTTPSFYLPKAMAICKFCNIPGAPLVYAWLEEVMRGWLTAKVDELGNMSETERAMEAVGDMGSVGSPGDTISGGH